MNRPPHSLRRAGRPALARARARKRFDYEHEQEQEQEGMPQATPPLWSLWWRCPCCGQDTLAHWQVSPEALVAAGEAAFCPTARYTCAGCCRLASPGELAWYVCPENPAANQVLDEAPAWLAAGGRLAREVEPPCWPARSSSAIRSVTASR